MKYQEYCPKCDRVTPSRAVRGATTVEYVCAVCGLSVGIEFLDDEDNDSQRRWGRRHETPKGTP